MDRDGAEIGSRREGCIGSREIILYDMIRRKKPSQTEHNGVVWRQENACIRIKQMERKRFRIITTVEDEALANAYCGGNMVKKYL